MCSLTNMTCSFSIPCTICNRTSSCFVNWYQATNVVFATVTNQLRTKFFAAAAVAVLRVLLSMNSNHVVTQFCCGVFHYRPADSKRMPDAIVFEASDSDGLCSVGAHVRDAAAYVCWAFARAYTAQELAPSIPLLAPSLLVTACYDREVQAIHTTPCLPCWKI